MRSIVSVICFISIVLTGCGGKQSEVVPELAPARKPTLLIIESVVDAESVSNRMKEPSGLAVDFAGSVYLTDRAQDFLIKLTPDLKMDKSVGGFGSDAGLFSNPSFLTVDNNLNLLISDEDNRRVVRYNKQLNYVDEISFRDPDEPGKFGFPSGVGVTAFGETWIADVENHRIAVFNNVSRFTQFVGDFGYPGGQLRSPEKIVMDGSNFVVCDAGNRRLVIYDEYGGFVRQLTNDGFKYPLAAVPDGSGMWVLDGTGGQVFYLGPRGEELLRIGPNIPGNPVSLKSPTDIARLPDGRLVISDSGNGRLVICRVVLADR